MTCTVILLKNSNIISEVITNKIAKNVTMAILLQASLYFYRFLANTKKVVFLFYLIANFCIIVSFYYARIYMISHFPDDVSNSIILGYFILFLLSTIFVITRLFFRIGYIIDNDKNILFTLDHVIKGSVTMFGNIGRRLVGAMPAAPGNGGVNRDFALDLVTCSATVVAAVVVVFLAYDIHMNRLEAERQAVEAERQAIAAVRQATLARRTVDFQTLSPEIYNAKWDEYGNLRKK
jgi:hypothetical protein